MITLRVRRPRSRRPMESHPKTTPPVTNPPESFFDVLNRDQRTIVTIDRKCRSDSFQGEKLPRLDRFQPYKISNSSMSGFIKKYNRPRTRFMDLNRLICRLSEVFIVGVCVLTIIRVPTVMSAPSKTQRGTSYLYPCGRDREEELNKTAFGEPTQEFDPETLKHVILRSKTALSYADTFKYKYVEKTFQTKFEQQIGLFINDYYNWLPNSSNSDIKKQLGEEIVRNPMTSEDFDKVVVNSYEYLQKFCVALNHVVDDMKKYGSEFMENFRLMEVNVRNVLCEIREAMAERNLRPAHWDAGEVIPPTMKNINSISYRNVRDWLIFRDMMNALEYVIQVYGFFEENLSKSMETALS